MSFYKGFHNSYSPKNESKCISPSKIKLKSTLERAFAIWCDRNDSILSWGYEKISLQYISPKDGKKHKYIPDFWIRMLKKDGSIKDALVEIKPYTFTKMPEIQLTEKLKKPTRRYVNTVIQFKINEAKWNAARIFCNRYNMEFLIITEKDLKKNKK